MTAAKTKFQPIVLATVASVVAQLPLAFALGGNVAAMTQPMGIASVGGLIVSAILTMYLVPTFFWLPNALFHKAGKGIKKGSWREEHRFASFCLAHRPFHRLLHRSALFALDGVLPGFVKLVRASPYKIHFLDRL